VAIEVAHVGDPPFKRMEVSRIYFAELKGFSAPLGAVGQSLTR